MIDPTLRPEFQRVPLRAIGGKGRVEWRVDGRPIAGDAEWTLVRGVHRITARDVSGQDIGVTVTIK